MDSCQNNTTDQTVLQMAKIYGEEKDKLQITSLPVQQQKGSHDCGLFAIAYAIEICTNNNKLMSLRLDQGKMRVYLKESLECGRLDPFPRTRSKVVRCPEITESFNLYCICHMPDFLDTQMIQCDGCYSWYHKVCTNLKKKTPREWYCAKCTVHV